MKKIIAVALLTFASAGFGRAAKFCQKALSFAANSPQCASDSTNCRWAVGEGCDNNHQHNDLTPETGCNTVWFKGAGFHTKVPCTQGARTGTPPTGGSGDYYWEWCKPDGKTEWVCISSTHGNTLNYQNGATRCAGEGSKYYHLFYMMN